MRAWCLLTVVIALVWSDASAAVELRVESSALDKLLAAQVFRENGRWYLAKPDRCNDPYLETPSANIQNGRVRLKARFTGRVGREIAGICVSAGEPSWLTISGRPIIDRDVLMLTDVRVDDVEKAVLRATAERLIPAATKGGLRLNLQDAIRQLAAPANTAPYIVQLSDARFALTEVASDRLRISVDFTMTMR